MSQRVSDKHLAMTVCSAERSVWPMPLDDYALDLRDARAEISRLRGAEAAVYLRGLEDAIEAVRRADCTADRGRSVAAIRALQPGGGPND